MGQVILDSSVVIAFFNAGDAHHKVVVEAVAKSNESFSISMITVTETLVKASKVSEKRKNQLLSVLTENFAPFSPFDMDVAVRAATIRAQTGLRTPDAIISATATVAKATLWTCDARLAKFHKGALLIL